MRPAVFLWENFGPYHRDRLRAIAGSGRRATGIQFACRSGTHEWEPPADELDIRTLSSDQSASSSWRLAWRLLKNAGGSGAPISFCATTNVALSSSPRWWRELGKVLLFLPIPGR